MLLSFAQFEREMIAERTKDKMSAARRKGRWVGGIPILGYDIRERGGALGEQRIADLEALEREKRLIERELEPENQTFEAIVRKAHAAGERIRPTIWLTPVLNEGNDMKIKIVMELVFEVRDAEEGGYYARALGHPVSCRAHASCLRPPTTPPPTESA